MEKRHLHLKGPTLSRIVAGCWRWDEKVDITKLVHTSMEAGITSFDHADIYGDYEKPENFRRRHKEESFGAETNAADQ